MRARADKRRRRLALAAVLIAWWALLGGMWMLLVDTVSTAEVLGAVAASLLAALATRLVFGGVDAMRPAASLAVALARQLGRVPADLWLLALALRRALGGRRRPGRFHELALELPASARGDGRRSAIELIGSLAPNTIVLGVDERRVIVHQLLACHAERENVVEISS